MAVIRSNYYFQRNGVPERACKQSNGKVNKYLCKPNERTIKLSKALMEIKKERKIKNDKIREGLCGNGTISEVLNGLTGGTDEFYKLAMENIGGTFLELLIRAGLDAENVQKNGVQMEAPETKKPVAVFTPVRNFEDVKFPNGMTPMQTWLHAIEHMKLLGKNTNIVNMVERYTRYGEWRNGTIYVYVRNGDGHKMVLDFLNAKQHRTTIETFVGCDAKRPIKFEAVMEPDNAQNARIRRCEDEKPASAPKVEQVTTPAPKPVTSETEAKQTVAMSAGTEKLLSREEREYLIKLIDNSIQATLKRSAENHTYPNPKHYGMMVHILEVLKQ